MIPYTFPPAETRLTTRSLIHGFLSKDEGFAEKLNRYLEVEACALADSARSLLFLLFSHLRSKSAIQNGHILMPGYTCYSVPAAAVKSGLRVALYNIHPQSFQPDMEDVERKISPETLAVVGQHLLGVRSDISGLTRIAHSKGSFCIEDSAQLLQPDSITLQKDLPADFTLFSFGRGKPLPLGSGGALVAANGKDLEKIVMHLSCSSKRYGNYFLPLAVRAFSNPSIYWLLEKLPLGLGQTVYDPDFQISSMPRMYQKLGVSALPELEHLNKHRMKISSIYNEILFQGKDGQVEWPISPFVRYPLLVRNRVLPRILHNYGIRKLYPHPLSDLAALQCNILQHGEKQTGSRTIAKQLITLPTHLSVSENLAKKIAKKCAKLFMSSTSYVELDDNQGNNLRKSKSR